MINVDAARCPEDHPCPLVRRCPAGAINQVGVKAPTIDANKCIECGICLKACPYRVMNPSDSAVVI